MKSTTLLFLFLLFLTLNHDVYGSPSISLDELRENFLSIYKEDHEKFWSVIYIHENSVKNCTDTGNVQSFLMLGGVPEDIAEFNGYYNEIVENLATKQTICLLKTYNNLDKFSKETIISTVRNPYTVNHNEMKTKLCKHSMNKKFQSFYLSYKHCK